MSLKSTKSVTSGLQMNLRDVTGPRQSSRIAVVDAKDIDDGHIEQEQAVKEVEGVHLVRPLDAQEHSEDSDQNLLEHILENEGGQSRSRRGGGAG